MVGSRNGVRGGGPLRFVAFGPSIVSDWGNPIATSARAVCSALAKRGNEVTYFEQRGNAAVHGLLQRHGSHAVRAFSQRYQSFAYRTYDLPRGWERTVWFGREAGTADVVIALPGTPDSLLPEIAALPSPHPVTCIHRDCGIDGGAIRLIGVDDAAEEGTTPFGPAVAPQPHGDGNRLDDVLVVAYDEPEPALDAIAVLGDRPYQHVVAGSAVLPGWPFVPEVELVDLYQRHRAAVVCELGGSAWSQARRLLPFAGGCHSFDMVDPRAVSGAESLTDARLPSRYDATEQAAALIAAVEARLLGRIA